MTYLTPQEATVLGFVQSTGNLPDEMRKMLGPKALSIALIEWSNFKAPCKRCGRHIKVNSLANIGGMCRNSEACKARAERRVL